MANTSIGAIVKWEFWPLPPKLINLANTTVADPFVDGETIGVTVYNHDYEDIGVDPYFKDLQVSGKLILHELPVEDD